MSREKSKAHPYIPNSVPEVQKEMLDVIGAASIDELYQDIPEHLRFRGTLNLPKALVAESDLKRHEQHRNAIEHVFLRFGERHARQTPTSSMHAKMHQTQKAEDWQEHDWVGLGRDDERGRQKKKDVRGNSRLLHIDKREEPQQKHPVICEIDEGIQLVIAQQADTQ